MPEAASGRKEDSPARSPSRLDSPSLRAELIGRLSDRVWKTESELERGHEAVRELDRELQAVYASSSWRVTRPIRAVANVRSKALRVPRRALKVLWWTVTLQLRARLRDRRLALAEAERERADAHRRSIAEWFSLYETLSDEDMGSLRELCDQLPSRPLVSVLMPVFDPPERILREAIESVRNQLYDRWELCIADDASTEPHVRRVLREFEQRDERIRVVYRSENGGISTASNDALARARGEILVLLDHDDLLRPHSVLLAVREFVDAPWVGYVYSDTLVVDASGRPFGHYFKPDWNQALILSQNFLCHLSAIRADLVRAAGGFRKEFDGSQDWDLALRVTERLAPEGVVHIPHVLYLWRAIPGSVAAEGVDAKPYAVDAGRRAAEDHLRRGGRLGYVLPLRNHQKVRYLVPRPQPRVDVVVPSTGRRDLLEPCIQGVLSRTDYENLRVTVVVPRHAYAKPANRSYLERLDAEMRARVITYPPRPFNFARIVNDGMASTDAPFVLLLNDDVEVLEAEWLESMVGYALHDRAGVVGGLLLYPDRSIQSAGLLVGARGAAEHLYHHRGEGVFGYSNRARLPQDLTAVAGTCMLVRRDAYDDVGGWDEAFPAAYNDVDFCLRLRAAGWRVVYVPDAAVIHRESATFGKHQLGRVEEHRADLARLQVRWGEALGDDPMHNPNLELDASHPDRLAFPPRAQYPWRGASGSARSLVATPSVASDGRDQPL